MVDVERGVHHIITRACRLEAAIVDRLSDIVELGFGVDCGSAMLYTNQTRQLDVKTSHRICECWY